MHDRTEQVDDLHLVALPSAVGCAEMFVRFSLTEWSLRDLRDLAANTIRALTQAVVAAADQRAPGMMTARARLSGGDLVIEIEPPHAVAVPEVPAGARAGVLDIGGGRTMLWAAIALPSGMNASAVPLPRRQRRPSSQTVRGNPPDEPIGADAETMQRILFGLNGRRDRDQR
ncbi:ATP-binding protein [Actinokineospora soli]|uniref:ATP-binding protein n=1 Tax=Actinokineospora soli TaxID=1048753 RepID=A0ABW2TJX6_9PSEU